MCEMRSMAVALRRQCGLSLLELLLVTSLVAITLSIGVPRAARTIEQWRVESSTRALFAAINYARHEAIMRGHSVSLCPSRGSAGGDVECAGTYSDGWLVFSNRDRDAVVDTDEDTVLRVFDGVPRGYRVMNRKGTAEVTGALHYLADGSAHRNLTLQVCPPNPKRVQSVSVVLNIVGRARLDRNWGRCEPLV